MCPYATLSRPALLAAIAPLTPETAQSALGPALAAVAGQGPAAACRAVFDVLNGTEDSVFDCCTCFPPRRDCTRCRDAVHTTPARPTSPRPGTLPDADAAVPAARVPRALFHSPNDYYAYAALVRSPASDSQEHMSQDKL